MSNLDIATDDPCQYSLVYPELQPYSGSPPVLPASWYCTAILHPFSPPPADDPKPDTPFFQLCTAAIVYTEGVRMAVKISGCEYGTWIYLVYPDRTELSTDGGRTWTQVDMGWSLPSTNWFAGTATEPVCVGTSYLNWMQAQEVNWWKAPVPNSNASTWYWFNASGDSAGLPFRLMFGQPPPQPTKGDPDQLALFQMYSFTYFPKFVGIKTEPGEADANLSDMGIEGFECGNPHGYQKVIWNTNFGMTTFMTPVNETSNPLPTKVLYKWKGLYRVLTDRAQNTLMWYTYNPNSGLLWEEALMFGAALHGTPPPHSGSGFIIDTLQNGSQKCSTLPLGQEPPNWAYVPGVDGTIQATITNNSTLCPNNTVVVISVIFPPGPGYPQGRYLWTWYSPFPGSDGTHSRPVTFMESASTITEGGTSLALADYFDYKELATEIDPGCFQIPDACIRSESLPKNGAGLKV